MTRARWGLLAILLLAAGLRFYRVGEICLRADEAVNFYLALKEPAEIIRAFITDDPHQPLYFLLLHLWLRLAGTSELALRFPTLAAGIVLVALVYVLCRQLFADPTNIARIAAVLAAFHPTLIWDAQDAGVYAVLAPAVLISFIAFVRILLARATWSVWWAYVLTSAVSLHLHYLAAFALVAQGVVMALFILTRKTTLRRILAWSSASIAIGMLFVPWLVIVFPMLINFKTDFLPAVSLGEMLLRSLHAFSIGRIDARVMPPMSDPLWGNVGALGFLVVFVYGVGASGDRWARVIVSLYLAGALGAMFVFSQVRFPIFDERYVAFFAPAFIVLVARGIGRAYALIRPAWLALLMGVFLLFANAYSLYNYFYVPTFAKSPDWRGFTQQIITAAQAGDVVIQNYPDPALPYYLQERVPRVLLPRSSTATLREVNADLQRVTSKYTRVWFQAAPYSTWDTEGLVAQWLARHARRLGSFELRGLRLLLYQPALLAVQRATAVEAIFDEQVRLRAFDLDRRDSNVLRVTLYWQAITRPTRTATVFVHLYDPAWNLVVQQDNQPLDGTYPTTEWDIENIVVDEYVLTIPDKVFAETYSIVVGLYDSMTQTRWNVRDMSGNVLPQNQVHLGAVTQ